MLNNIARHDAAASIFKSLLRAGLATAILAIIAGCCITLLRSEPAWSTVYNGFQALNYHPLGDSLMGGSMLDPSNDAPVWRARPLVGSGMVSQTLLVAAWLFTIHLLLHASIFGLYGWRGRPRLIHSACVGSGGVLSIAARSTVVSAAMGLSIPVMWYALWMFWGAACEPMRGDTTVVRTFRVIAITDSPTFIATSLLGALVCHALLVAWQIRRTASRYRARRSADHPQTVCDHCMYPLPAQRRYPCPECGACPSAPDSPPVLSLASCPSGSRSRRWVATLAGVSVALTLLLAPRLSMLALNAIEDVTGNSKAMVAVGSFTYKADVFIVRLLGYP